MKFTLALALAVAAVAAVSCSTDVSGPVQYERSIKREEDDSSPVQFNVPVNDVSIPVKDSSAPEHYVLKVGVAIARNSLLHSAHFVRSAVANTVHVHDHTWIGAPSQVITSVWAYQLGPNLGATAWIISGGVGRNFVTVRIQSLVGFGFNVVVDIYGR